MNMKKLLILGLILIAFSTTLTALSADEKVTSESMTLVNNKLTINDINFNIPDGFEDVESDSDSSGLDEDGEKEVEDIDGTPIDSKLSKEFKNSAGEKLEIEVGIKANNEKIDKINLANAEQKTIAGKEGFLVKEVDDGKNEYKFEYLEDGKLVKIVANSEDVINQVIAWSF